MNEILRNFLALLIVALGYHLMGSLIAYKKGEFDKKLFKGGVITAAAITIGCTALYGAGLLAPTVEIVAIADKPMTLLDAFGYIVLLSFGAYAVALVKKIMELRTVKAANEPTVEGYIPEYEIEAEGISHEDTGVG